MQADQRAAALAEELYRVLFEVFLVLGRRDPGGILPGDLTLAQLSILMTLQERGPMRMTALAAHQRVRTPTITVAIRRLEKLGLVDRSGDPTDLRAVVVRITPQGDAMCCDALATRHVQFAAMLKALSPEDHVTLNEAISPLERLARHDDASHRENRSDQLWAQKHCRAVPFRNAPEVPGSVVGRSIDGIHCCLPSGRIACVTIGRRRDRAVHLHTHATESRAN